MAKNIFQVEIIVKNGYVTGTGSGPTIIECMDERFAFVVPSSYPDELLSSCFGVGEYIYDQETGVIYRNPEYDNYVAQGYEYDIDADEWVWRP